MKESLFSVLLVLAGSAVALVAWNWEALTDSRFRNDLQDYARTIRQSDLSLRDKERLLDEVDSLEDRYHRGERIGFSEWRRTNAAIRNMLRGAIEDDQVRLIQRELQRAQGRMSYP